MEREIICVACPMGCGLHVEFNSAGEITDISGNGCKRGISYAQAEITNPTRSFHSTIRVDGGNSPLVSVKSAKPVPKSLLLDCAKATKTVHARAPIAIGDVLLPNVCGTEVDLIATMRVAKA